MSAAPRGNGFTLVETLVVIAIMGLLAATAVLAWPAGGGLRDDARTLAARATLAAQESILSGAATGLDVTAAGYAFYRLHDGRWREMEGERVFRRQAWREGVVPVLEREGLRARTPRPAPAVPAAPAIVFDPTGLATPFRLTLAENGERIVVAGDGGGRIAAQAAVDD